MKNLYSLIEVVDWTGAFLVTAAIVLLSILFGALFKPLTYEGKETRGYVTEVDKEFNSNNGASVSKLPEIEEMHENADDMANMPVNGTSECSPRRSCYQHSFSSLREWV